MARQEMFLFEEQHESHTSDKGKRVTVERGNVISFRYKDEDRWVFVVHPDWEDKLHGLDLNYIPRTDLIPLFEAPSDMDNHEFYNIYVDTDLIKGADGYRTYHLNKMTFVRVHRYELEEA